MACSHHLSLLPPADMSRPARPTLVSSSLPSSTVIMLTEPIDEQIVSVVLPEHADLAGHPTVPKAIEEEQELYACACLLDVRHSGANCPRTQRGSNRDQGRNVQRVRVVIAVVGDERPRGLDDDDQVDGAHAVDVVKAPGDTAPLVSTHRKPGEGEVSTRDP